ncbi:hypothetical protein PIB30_060414 [Stylosanthes scabra]|uniref:C2H2-type domain-containing protein n=1 Tax=Stylosanthes scabra TaxID=79078 RepID=A0ABU6SLK4_9FABA|nr:hypothetical protein [Stylosanthes scabra]
MDCKEHVSNTTNNFNCNVVHHDSTHHIAKGKRTKRLRLLCGGGTAIMVAATAASSCSSASGDQGSGSGGDGSFSISSTTNQEEEDMANCLILLAQGGGGGSGGGGGGEYPSPPPPPPPHHHHQEQAHPPPPPPPQVDDQQEEDHDCGNNNKIEIKSRKFSEIETATANKKVGFYIYECKTCNRTFPSFQALGGHRASHKKPKLTTIPAEEKKPPPPPPPSPPPPPPSQVMIESVVPPYKNNNPIISLQFESGQKGNFHGNSNKANKIHECSICGSEFTSGQALGGHMRRHRATAAAAANNTAQTTGLSGIKATSAVITTAEVQPRNILELDLNLPAPEEDLREAKFQFTTAATKKSMVLSAAPALVDCHY